MLLHCALIEYFVRHPERRKGHGFVRWLSLCSAYQRLPLEGKLARNATDEV